MKPTNKRRILVADDDHDIREMFRLVLACDLPDLRVDVVVNGAEAVEAFRSVYYDIMVMDINMPVMDGEKAFEAIRKVCKEENLEMPSFLFCTGNEPSHSLQNLIAGNPRHCLLKKPVDPDALVEALKARITQ